MVQVENSVGISQGEITAALARIRNLAHHAKNTKESEQTISSFDHMLAMAKNSISEINRTQIQAENLNHAYLTGESDAPISKVLIAGMKSKLAFEGLLVVRNKLLDAYKEIMNMPV